MKEIYPGNLLYRVTHNDLPMLFTPYRSVYSVKLIAETEPDHPQAYVFVEMAVEEAEEATRMLDRMEFFGRTLRMEEAVPEKASA